jgi:hypothetical protein
MSAFKTLFTEMVNANGDASKINKDLTKQNLRLFVKETHPYFLVSDSFFFVPAYFTKAAMDKFEKKFNNISVVGLKEKVILITNWSLELKKVNSNAVFTSYAGLEVRLIVNAFEPVLGESITPTRTPTNLYRDDEFKTTIQAMRHRAVAEAVAKLPAAEFSHGKGDNVAQGIVASTKDDWNFKQGNTEVVALGEVKKSVAVSGAAKVKGGAAAKRAGKAVAKENKKVTATKAKTVTDKVMKFTPKKVEKGKKSTAKKASPAKPVKSAEGTTDRMTMKTLKNYIKFQKDGKKGALGKRSASKKATK